jgi:dipeptidyl aminopeptidase/acylaminoacyl peptidase
MRGMDGSSAIRLGSGSFPSLSPDGKWVAALSLSSPSQIQLLPTGAGQPRQLTSDALEHIRVRWVPSAQAVVFTASEPNHAPRSYVMNVADGKSRAITPEGTVGVVASADGKFLLVTDPDRKRWLYPLEGGDPKPFSATLQAGDQVIDWEPDGKSILVLRPGIPAKVYRAFLDSSRTEDIKTLSPSDPAGIITVGGARFSADRKSYAYNYFRILSELYVVDGLQ